MSDAEIIKEEVLYYWEVPADYPVKSDDIGGVADAYKVVLAPNATDGIVVYGLYGDEWTMNPRRVRPLIKQLLMVDDYSSVIGQFVVLNPVTPEMAQALLVKAGRLMQHPGGSFERILKAMEGALL